MTNQQHPLTPPPELKQELYGLPQMMVIEKAFQAGADQELEACCEYLKDNELCDQYFYKVFRDARRPKPPSLAEEALELLENTWNGGHISNRTAQTIRRALERLQQLEEQQ